MGLNFHSIQTLLVICSKCRTFHKALVEHSPWAFDEAVKNEKGIDTRSSPSPARYQLKLEVLIYCEPRKEGEWEARRPEGKRIFSNDQFLLLFV